MNELQEAELFSKELDKLLSGESGGAAAGTELAKDLRLAALVRASDFAAGSRVRRSLKTKLLAQGAPAPRRWFHSPALRWGGVVAACASLLLVFVIRPYLEQHLAMYTMGELASNMEGTSSSSWMAPGSALGGSGNGAYVERRPMEMASFRKLFRDKSAPRHSSAGHREIIGMGLAERYKEKSAVTMGASAAATAGPADAETEPDFNTEGYSHIAENPFQKAVDEPLSTFSIDVDAASYANARRFLNDSRLPPKDAVRVEEFINYFRYSYPDPEKGKPFSITTEVAACPWAPKHKLVRIGLQGKRLPMEALPANNLVFLIDSSGSMADANKLPLLKSSFRLLVDQLRAKDRIAIVAYAGAAGLVLPSTSGKDKTAILDSLEKLEAGGSTAGGQGITLAYQTAAEHFLKNGNNRVILATDGDFNVGVTSDGELTRLIEGKRKKGIFLTVLGFGSGNYQDAKMEKLADIGNGNYAYIDDILEARKVLVQELGATLLTIAKDVKLQIEFNPARVQAYRLIGYENRLLAAEDFNDDKKDAGELGAGHSVTALYEVIPTGVEADLRQVDPLKYQKTAPVENVSAGKELLTVKFRYKDPDGEKSKLIEWVLEDSDAAWSAASEDFQFATAAAGFAMRLRGSAFIGDFGYGEVEKMARGSLGKDEGGYRAEFVRLVERARLLGK